MDDGAVGWIATEAAWPEPADALAPDAGLRADPAPLIPGCTLGCPPAGTIDVPKGVGVATAGATALSAPSTATRAIASGATGLAATGLGAIGLGAIGLGAIGPESTGLAATGLAATGLGTTGPGAVVVAVLSVGLIATLDLLKAGRES